MTGAKLVGRYKNGCPIEQKEFQTSSNASLSFAITAAMRIDFGKAHAGEQHFVSRTGGEEYYFSPSLDTLQALGTGTI
jgi:hypothetical protein